jgi:hypothetical protein
MKFFIITDGIMKRKQNIGIILFIVISLSCSRQGFQYDRQRYEPQGYVDFQIFYDHLSPYGQWTNFSDYGYVWIPGTGRNFFPYLTNGQWVMTEYGWTWLSGYPWGWAPFHYGRWDYDNYYGWFWVPGNQWGPAWVTWRRASGYYGWAPMRPGMSINLSITQGPRDVNRWVFVRENDFGRSDIQKRYVDRRDNERIFKNSTIINNTHIDSERNTTYVSGPRPEDVQRTTGRRIDRMPVRDYDRPGQRISDSQLQIYRPQVRQSDASGQGQGQQAPRPPRITDPEKIRRPGARENIDRSMENRSMERRVPRQGAREQEIKSESRDREVYPGRQQRRDERQLKRNESAKDQMERGRRGQEVSEQEEPERRRE